MFNMFVVIVTCESYLLIQNGDVHTAAQLPKSEEDLTNLTYIFCDLFQNRDIVY